MTRSIARYGWKPQLPDFRDLVLPPSELIGALPPHVDRRPECPPVYDQGNLGSCTANAIAGMIHFDRLNQGKPVGPVPSRLFIYYNERAVEGTVDQDAGAELRDGLGSVGKLGACFESGGAAWPYIDGALTTKPPAICYEAAEIDRATRYYAVPQSLPQLKACLADGHPFVFGFTVYDSFESGSVAASGIVPMPAPSEQVVGGHAVMAVGYDDAEQMFIIRNSWGASWGQAGYCEMPYAYLLDEGLSSDFWTIRTVS